MLQSYTDEEPHILKNLILIFEFTFRVSYPNKSLVCVLYGAPKQYADLFGRLVVLVQKDLNRRGVVPVALRVHAHWFLVKIANSFAMA